MAVEPRSPRTCAACGHTTAPLNDQEWEIQRALHEAGIYHLVHNKNPPPPPSPAKGHGRGKSAGVYGPRPSAAERHHTPNQEQLDRRGRPRP